LYCSVHAPSRLLALAALICGYNDKRPKHKSHVSDALRGWIENELYEFISEDVTIEALEHCGKGEEAHFKYHDHSLFITRPEYSIPSGRCLL
jgi:hypothetical protein